MLLKSSISTVANYNLENFTTKKVANDLGISEGSIYNYYPTKKDLLIACLYYIDRQVDEVLRGVSLHITKIPAYVHDMWYDYFHYFTEHPDYASFYLQFRHSAYYNNDVIKGQNKSFSFFSKFLQINMKFFNVDPDIFWIYIIETTLNFAVYIATHSSTTPYKNLASRADSIYLMISNGIKGVYLDDDVLM